MEADQFDSARSSTPHRVRRELSHHPFDGGLGQSRHCQGKNTAFAAHTAGQKSTQRRMAWAIQGFPPLACLSVTAFAPATTFQMPYEKRVRWDGEVSTAK